MRENYVSGDYLVVPYGQLEIILTQAEHELLLAYQAKPLARRQVMAPQAVLAKVAPELAYLVGLGFVCYDDCGVGYAPAPETGVEPMGSAQWRLTGNGLNFVRTLQEQKKLAKLRPSYDEGILMVDGSVVDVAHPHSKE